MCLLKKSAATFSDTIKIFNLWKIGGLTEGFCMHKANEITRIMEHIMKAENSIPFGKNLSRIMKKKQLRLEDVSRITQVSKSVVHSWMTGSIPRDLRAVKRLSDAVGISFSELLLSESEKLRPEENNFKNEGGLVFDGLCRLRIERVAVDEGFLDSKPNVKNGKASYTKMS